MYVLLINIIINDDDAGIDGYGDDDDDEKDIDEENLDPGGRRVESGAAFQGFFKSELKLDFFPIPKVLHSGTQPEMLDIRLNGESLCSTVGGCGGGRI